LTTARAREFDNLLSNWLSNPVLTTGLTNGCIVYTAGCQKGNCTTRFNNSVERTVAVRSTLLSNRLSNPCQTGCQTRLTTGLTTGWMYVYTIQPVVKPVVQPVVSCKLGIRLPTTFNYLDGHFNHFKML